MPDDSIEKKENVEQNSLLVSVSPHIHSGMSIKKIMLMVILSLIPGAFAGVIFFGLPALKVIIFCIAFCVIFEYIFGKLAGHPNDWKDLSAVVTGLLLAMNLSSGIPWWVCLIGSFIAIGIAKQLYGGIGYNPFNPALVARVALLVGFPKMMTTWLPTLNMASSESHPLRKMVDAVTCATPLGDAKKAVIESAGSAGEVFSYLSSKSAYFVYLVGDRPGCLGETSVIALLAGGIFLIALKLIRWQVPFAFIGTVALITGITHHFQAAATPEPLFHILTGGLFLGAFFMATDMVTSPITGKGALIFGIGCGLITSLIRIWGGYPEGVSFSILIMNALTPMIDKFTGKKPFGMKKLTQELKK
jgi:electron transport complex protein RnfD